MHLLASDPNLHHHMVAAMNVPLATTKVIVHPSIHPMNVLQEVIDSTLPKQGVYELNTCAVFIADSQPFSKPRTINSLSAGKFCAASWGLTTQ